MKHSNKSKRLVSGMLGTACLLSLFSGVAMADVNVSMEQGTPETKIELNKTYKGEKDYGYYSFIPEETGAYLLDNNDFNDEVDSFAFVYCFDDASSLALFRKGDDSYGIFEKGKEYSISVGNEEDGYELTVKKADFGASLYQDYTVKYGEKITIKPQVVSKGNVKYEWLDPDDKVIGTGKELTLQPDRNTEKCYSCKITLANGDTDYFYFSIRVEFDLYSAIVKKGENFGYVNVNEDFELEVLTSGSYKPSLTYQWYKNNEAIKGATGKTLKTKTDKAAEYSCYMTDDKGNEFVTYYSIRIDNGYYYATCEPVTVKKGSDATLKVKIENEGAEGLTFEWRDDMDTVIGTGPEVTIKDVQKTAYYVCAITDKYGNDNYVSSQVIVENHFTVEQDPDWYTYIGDATSVELKLKVTADEKDGMEYYWSVTDKENRSWSANDTETLTITDITSDLFAQCFVVDKYGTMREAYFSICLGEDPDAKVKPFVDRCYTYILGRENASGYFWCEKLRNMQMTGAEVVRGFLWSPEFQEKNVSDDEYINILYKTILGRECDADGKAYWSSQLASGAMDRLTVTNGFFDSREWIDLCAQYEIRSGSTIENKTYTANDKTNSFVERMYTKALARDFDEEGKKYWANELANFRMSGEQVALFFFMSDELTNANISNEEFLNRLYSTFMDRAADPEGYQYWIGVLDRNEITREAAVLGFSRSSEFVSLCEDAKIIAYFE